MITTRVETIIRRPVAVVFTYVTGVAHFPEWAGALVVTARQTSPGPLGVGSTFHQENRMLIRRFATDFRVVRYDPERRFTYQSTRGPIQFLGDYTFTPVEDGTRFLSLDKSDPGPVLRPFAPLMQPLVQKQIEANIARLKAVIEALPGDLAGGR